MAYNIVAHSNTFKESSLLIYSLSRDTEFLLLLREASSLSVSCFPSSFASLFSGSFPIIAGTGSISSLD